MTLSDKDLQKSLQKWQESIGGRIRETGESSVAVYAAMPREDLRTFYCIHIDGLNCFLGEEVRETERFPNMKLLETSDEFVYFGSVGDRPPKASPFQASAIQSNLELAGGDTRDQEPAEQVRRLILGHAKDSAAKDLHGPADPRPARPAL